MHDDVHLIYEAYITEGRVDDIKNWLTRNKDKLLTLSGSSLALLIAGLVGSELGVSKSNKEWEDLTAKELLPTIQQLRDDKADNQQTIETLSRKALEDGQKIINLLQQNTELSKQNIRQMRDLQDFSSAQDLDSLEVPTEKELDDERNVSFKSLSREDKVILSNITYHLLVFLRSEVDPQHLLKMQQDLKDLVSPERVEFANKLKAANLFYNPAETVGRALTSAEMFESMETLRDKDPETFEHLRKRSKQLIDIFGITSEFMNKRLDLERSM